MSEFGLKFIYKRLNKHEYDIPLLMAAIHNVLPVMLEKLVHLNNAWEHP